MGRPLRRLEGQLDRLVAVLQVVRLPGQPRSRRCCPSLHQSHPWKTLVRVVWVAPALIRTKQSFTTGYRIVAKNYRLFACTCRFLRYETIFDLLTDSTEAHFTCDKCYRVDANVLNYAVLSLTIPVLICFSPSLRFYSSFFALSLCTSSRKVLRRPHSRVGRRYSLATANVSGTQSASRAQSSSKRVFP
jgi:hypothetical protein